MAIFRRRICLECKAQARDSRFSQPAGSCTKCGAATSYTENWYVSVSVKGKKVVKAVSPSRSDAVAEEARLIFSRRLAPTPAYKCVSFQKMRKSFLAWVISQTNQNKLSPNSAKSYVTRMDKSLLPWFRDLSDVMFLTMPMVDSYVNFRLGHVSPATINREISTLKKALTVCVRNREIPSNPIAGYEGLPEEGGRDKYLSKLQISLLLRECAKESYPAHLLPIVQLALNTGLRRDGCLTLRWEEVQNGEIIKKIKGNKLVRIPLTPFMAAELELWRSRGGVYRSHGVVFPSPKTGEAMLVSSNFGFERALKAVGLGGIVFHDLRRTFATHYLEQYPDKIETLRVLMGHSGAYMTRKYAMITDRSRQETMRELDVGCEG